MSEQDEKIVNLGRLKKFKEYYDTDITTPINNKINSKTNVQSGETITTNNDTIGYFKDIKINGNTRYKKSDGTYTDTWEDGVSLESMGEKEKNSNGKYPIIIKSSNDTKEDKRTVLLDSPLRKVGAIADVLDLEKMKVTRKTKSITLDDGTITNWVQAKIGNNSILWYIILSDATPSAPSMCDELKNDNTLWEHDVSGAYRIDETKAFQIRTDKTISNLSALTTWLQANPVTVVYQLATPITEDIDVSSNTLTDFTTSCTLTIDNTIKGNIECNEVVGLIPSVEEDEARLANVEKSLENKAEKTHNHDDSYLKLSGGTITDNVDFANGKGIHGKDSKGTNQRMIVVGADDCCYLGGVSIHTYIRSSDCPQYLDSSGNKYDFYHSGNFSKDMAVLFERNNAKINKNVNSCFNKETGKFTASKNGQYLVMCSGYELARNSTEYVACVLNEESGNQNKLYIIGNSGFTLITLTKDQTLAIYTCVAGNVNQSCISSMPYVNMLIAKIN